MVGEKLVYLQFESDEIKKNWQEGLKSTIVKLKKTKPKIIEDPLLLVDRLITEITRTHNLQKGPLSGEEDRWISQMKLYFSTREKYLKTIKHAMKFSAYLLPSNKSFCDWFTLSGGDVDGSNTSLEKDLLIAEDYVIGKWKDQFMAIQKMEETLNTEIDEKTANIIRQQCRDCQKVVDLYHKYMKEIYTKEPQYNYVREKWKDFENRAEKFAFARKELLEEAKKNAQVKYQQDMKKQQEDQIRQLEIKRKQKADPFYMGQDPEDDPFADVKIKTLKF